VRECPVVLDDALYWVYSVDWLDRHL